MQPLPNNNIRYRRRREVNAKFDKFFFQGYPIRLHFAVLIFEFFFINLIRSKFKGHLEANDVMFFLGSLRSSNTFHQ